MKREELLTKLDALVHTETDAMALYAEAVNCATEHCPDMKAHMERHLADHKRHAEAIAATIIRLGGKAPNRDFDAMGRHLHWPTMLHANPCREGTLDALSAAEHYHNHVYAEALRWELHDAQLAAMLREFAADEARHKEFVAQQLAVYA